MFDKEHCESCMTDSKTKDGLVTLPSNKCS